MAAFSSFFGSDSVLVSPSTGALAVASASGLVSSAAGLGVSASGLGASSAPAGLASSGFFSPANDSAPFSLPEVAAFDDSAAFSLPDSAAFSLPDAAADDSAPDDAASS